MSKSEAKKRIEKLKQEINFHRYNYHVLDKESISEAALDGLKNELFKLEQQFPELITPDSPTQRVEGRPLEKFVKSTHLSPMLSLFDAFSQEDMISWQERLGRFLFGAGFSDNNRKWSYYCELKLDGLAVNLKYHQGKLIEGASRGDGKIGENITSNIKTINSIPLDLIIPDKKDLSRLGLDSDALIKHLKSDWIEVRGEAIMGKKTFQKLNLKYQAEGKPLLSNTRNGAAGSLRQLDPRLSAERKLQFYAYDIIFYKNGRKVVLSESRYKTELLAKILGFKIVKHNSLCRNLGEVFDFHKKWEKEKEGLDFNIDGVVVKVNEFDFWDKMGVVGKAPRYAMAYKFSAEQGTTKIRDVIWQVGRTGILTPTAVLDPVNLAGANISRATLHNMDEIERLDIRIGDTIILERAGDVIPKVVSVLKNLRDGSEQKIYTPKKCPNCEGEVVKVGDEVAFRCSNLRCYAVSLRQITHFVSKNAIDIENLGPKVVEQLLKAGLVSDLADIYNLKKEDLLGLERFAEKSADNLIEAVNDRRQVDLARFIYSLGIRHVGQESAQVLAEHVLSSGSAGIPFPSLRLAGNDKDSGLMSSLRKQGSQRDSDNAGIPFPSLRSAGNDKDTYRSAGNDNNLLSVSCFIKIFSQLEAEHLAEINDFGPKVSQSVVDYFKDEHNIKILEKLDKFGLKILLPDPKLEAEKRNRQGGSNFFGKTFVLTGTLNNLTREQAKAKIKELGGRVLSAVSAKLDFLIVGDNPGSKEKKAKELGVKILNEDEFLKMIK